MVYRPPPATELGCVGLSLVVSIQVLSAERPTTVGPVATRVTLREVECERVSMTSLRNVCKRAAPLDEARRSPVQYGRYTTLGGEEEEKRGLEQEEEERMS
jgi:hypothetical protein